jgi:hypothetical protein
MVVTRGVGATRQGRHESLSGSESLQSMTTVGIDGSPLRTGRKTMSLSNDL